MSRHAFRFTLALTFIAFALMAVSGIGLAQSQASCTKTCTAYTSFVEVTPRREGRGKLIKEPTLPESAKAYRSLEHEYFRWLSETTRRMCSEAEEIEEVTGETAVGFGPQLADFNMVRQRLNKLLGRYSLGYAPDIEDFSHVTALSFIVPKPSKRLVKAGFTEGPIESVTSTLQICVFKIT